MTFIVHSGFISSCPLCVVYKELLVYVSDTLIFLFIAIPNKNSKAVFVCCLLSPPRAVFTDAQPAVLLKQTPVKTTLRILVSGGTTFHTEPLDWSGLHTLHTSCLFCLSELKRKASRPPPGGELMLKLNGERIRCCTACILHRAELSITASNRFSTNTQL